MTTRLTNGATQLAYWILAGFLFGISIAGGLCTGFGLAFWVATNQ